MPYPSKRKEKGRLLWSRAAFAASTEAPPKAVYGAEEPANTNIGRPEPEIKPEEEAFALTQDSASAELPLDLPADDSPSGTVADFEDVGAHIGGSRKEMAAIRKSLAEGGKLSMADAETLEDEAGVAAQLVTRDNAIDRKGMISGMRDLEARRWHEDGLCHPFPKGIALRPGPAHLNRGPLRSQR